MKGWNTAKRARRKEVIQTEEMQGKRSIGRNMNEKKEVKGIW